MDFTYDSSFNLQIFNDQTMIILKTTVHKVRIFFEILDYWIKTKFFEIYCHLPQRLYKV